ncbi:MAG TPA: hypothetical protein VM490_10990 [Armatimonadaceae bacterium]|nr:hypothetical protein [Armatimonadaceae bacterium]
MHRRFAVPGLLLLATLLTTPTVQAQNFSETRRGEGTLVRDGREDDSLREASISLRDDGSARLIFFGRRDRHTFEGRWTRGRSNDVSLRLNGDFGGDRATATGDLYLPSNRRGFERVTLNGSADGRRFYIRFEADGSGGRPWDNDWNSDWNNGRPNRPSRPGDLGRGNGRWDDRNDRGDWDDRGSRNDRDVSNTQSGYGTARTADRGSYSLNRASVNIRSNDDVRVVFYGQTTQSFGGRVTRRNGENVYVRLEGDIDGDKTILEGYINVRRSGGGFDRIVLDSRSGARFNVNFTAR